MKKHLLVLLAFGIALSSLAQQNLKFKLEPSYNYNNVEQTIGIEPVKELPITKSDVEPQIVIPPADRNVDIVTVIDLGTSANAWSYNSNNTGNQKSIVWADPELNIVTNFHRMGGDLDPGGYSGDLGYDISFDGGTTWTLMNECYIAVDNGGGEYFYDAARYPNHGIYNPTGNVEDAYVVFFCPNLDGSNSADDTGWGGYSFGVDNISVPDDTTGNYNRKSSHGEYIQNIPDAFDISAQGVATVFEPSTDWTGGTGIYTGNMLLNQGTWNEDEMDFVYEEFLLEFPENVDHAGPWFTSVAFAPDGMTGYLVMLSNDGDTWSVDGFPSIYPIFWKTTDGGESWDGPTAIQIDGPDGLGGVVNHLLSDQQIEDLFVPPVPARDEIPYTYTGDFEVAVDANGNLHIAGVVCAAGEATGGGISFFIADDMGAVIDIFTDDGGTTWYAEEMGRTRRYDGTWGDMTEGNRVQISTSPDQSIIFISWLDTDLEEEDSNSRPNIWARGFNPTNYMKTSNDAGEDAPTNVTSFSAGMWQSYFGTAAKFALEFVDDVYTIPYIYVEMSDPTDPGQPARAKYITDFSFGPEDWTITGVGNDIEVEDNVVVSQNYPNPFNGNSYVTVNLDNGADLSLEVYTITGQQVIATNYGYTTGTTTLTINGESLTPGVYFYTVKAGDSKVTRKMIVE